jgi:hypothetical protein
MRFYDYAQSDEFMGRITKTITGPVSCRIDDEKRRS